MSRAEEPIEGTVTRQLVSSMCAVRRNADGTGNIQFNGLEVIRLDGQIIAERETAGVRADFADLAGVMFNVQVAGAGVVPVAGETILNALEAVYDHIRAQGAQ